MSTSFFTRLATATRTAVAAAAIGIASITGVSATAVALASGANASPATKVAASGMYGDPEESAQYWQQQTLEDSCLLVSVAGVVGDVTGDLPSEREILHVARITPSVVADGPVFSTTDDVWGTSMSDALVLLDGYGVPAQLTNEHSQNQTGVATGMDALVQYLAEGRSVITAVNGQTIWKMEGDRTTANHAVVVTGVDTVNGVVHLNDPYPDNGSDLQVSIRTFNRAWAVGGNEMIVTA